MGPPLLLRRRHLPEAKGATRKKTAEERRRSRQRQGDWRLRVVQFLRQQDALRVPHAQQREQEPARRQVCCGTFPEIRREVRDPKSTRLNSSHRLISYAGLCLIQNI